MSINVFLIVRILILAIAIGGSVYLIWEFILIRRILSIKTTPGWNTDTVPINTVIELVNEATDLLEIYDDGNDMDDSLYKNNRFFEAIDHKIEDSQKQFRVICLFNEDANLEFKQHFSGNPNVEIYKRRSGRPLSPIHYKIIDTWKKAYLSRHGYGQHEREYRLIDCTNVKGRRSKNLQTTVFSEYRQNKEDDFQKVS